MNQNSTFTNWDPLEASRNSHTEVLTATQKREIKNILKSYVGQYDCFSELIQNAMDSVEKRKKLKESSYQPYLRITINLKENSFGITDNGVGFNEQELQAFLAPNISFKDKTGSRGNKGVGATYIAYGFNSLQFGTKTSSCQFTGEILNGRNWVEDNEGIITRPTVTKIQDSPDFFKDIDQGASFKIIFTGNNIRPKDLSWYAADTAEQWLYLLLIKTPLGCIYFQNEKQDKIVFDIHVINKQGEIDSLTNQDACYCFPEKKIIGSINLKDVLLEQQKLLENAADASKIPNKYTQGNALYEYFKKNNLLEIGKVFSEQEKELINKYQISAYAYFVYSTKVWDMFNDKKAKLRKGIRILRGGLQLANNKMIQGELLTIPLTSNIGYQNQCHVVVHFSDADPDLGRKGFQPELKELAEKISVVIINRFKKWNRTLLKTDEGTEPHIEKEKSLYDWIQAQENHETNKPICLKNRHFFNPVNEISIISEPQSEQDVIVLFNQLIAGGVIRGIKLYATSQIKQYDGIYRYEINEPFQLHEFHKTKNPLGIPDQLYTTPIKTRPKVLEYKYNLDALIREFKSEEKRAKDIDLVITWEIGTEYTTLYEITSLLDLENIHHRKFHGITHVLKSTVNTILVIALKELVEYLNNVDGVQKYHKEQYSSDLFYS